ncbi:hypothetical protein H7J86_21035 [Mycobacterium hackensackense]|uniref:hypothetical protein n=1 Tax=Mycobacterium hackensackense TaxID=228909 RepID=UPI002265CB12|nr:hypothetical protein [Mycobacterium hackensackense]MCV7254649.1 hypothetical protein [Mycobacterium hackensackense]
MDTGDDKDNADRPDARARFTMTVGDRLRACDFAVAFGEYIHDDDFSKVWKIVVEAELSGDTIADGLARTQNLLLSYIYLSIPFDKASVEKIRQQIVEDELRGMDLG